MFKGNFVAVVARNGIPADMEILAYLGVVYFDVFFIECTMVHSRKGRNKYFFFQTAKE